MFSYLTFLGQKKRRRYSSSLKSLIIRLDDDSIPGDGDAPGLVSNERGL